LNSEKTLLYNNFSFELKYYVRLLLKKILTILICDNSEISDSIWFEKNCFIRELAIPDWLKKALYADLLLLGIGVIGIIRDEKNLNQLSLFLVNPV
jgi:hypothetical protein